MRNLSEKLAMLSSQKPQPTRSVASDCYDETRRYPLEAGMEGLFGLRLSQVLAIDQRLPLPAFDPARVLFLDTETTGLSRGVGTVPFLVGLGWLEPDAFVLRQLMIRDYPEEVFLLHKLLELLPRFDLIVTYNGKTFDLPLVINRLVMHRLPVESLPEAHLDLLHPTRAVYKLRLTRCPLKEIEERVLGICRVDDLPGSQVPERFFTFLETGEFALLTDVLRHNDQDIRSLGLLFARLAAAYTEPEQLGFSQDVLSVGRVLEKRGRREDARRCFRLAGVGEAGALARAMLAGSHKRDREYDQAERVYLDMLARGEGQLLPYIELAKILEHRRRDYARALAYTQAALRLAWERDEQAVIPPLERRRDRLLARLGRVP